MVSPDILTKTKWIIDPVNSQISFQVKYLLFSNVRGSFKEFDAGIYTIGDDFNTADISFWINPASIDTGIEQRDAHLKNSDFFDVDQFNEITFEGTEFRKVHAQGRYQLTGDLTMKGVKKPVSLDVEAGGFIKDPWGSEKALFKVSGVINRKDWDLNWNTVLEAGGVLVSDDVWINCDVQLIKQS